MTKFSTSKTIIAEAVIVVALLCTAMLPAFADAAKPDVTGQERAATVGNKATVDSEESESEEDEDSEESAGKKDNPGQAKKTGTETGEKMTGLERAASAGNKPEEIRNQLTFIMKLIAQMKDAIEGRGIGAELSAFIANGRVLPDMDDDDEPMESGDFMAALVFATTSLEENDASTTEDNVGVYEFEMEITASGTDLMIPEDAGTEATTSVGFVFSILNASGTKVSTEDYNVAISSTGDLEDGSYEVLDGLTETFSITVEFDPTEEGEYRVQLEQIQVNGTFYDLTPAADYTSDAVSI